VGFDSLKATIGAREPKLGHFILEFASPGMGHILKDAGCDRVAFAGAAAGIASMRRAIAKGAGVNG
jgi:hypothetical protein